MLTFDMSSVDEWERLVNEVVETLDEKRGAVSAMLLCAGPALRASQPGDPGGEALFNSRVQVNICPVVLSNLLLYSLLNLRYG